MYTSGTAAEPKGALLTHEALTRFADGTKQTRFFLTPEDRIWTALPMFHIGGIAFSVATIYAGATLCHTGFFRPEVALDQIESMRCTIVLAAFETIWLPVVNLPDFKERDLSSVRIVMTVGVPERLRDMASRMPHAIQVSCFGMTEASSFLSLSYLTDTLEQRTSTGGHPMPGMECRVVSAPDDYYVEVPAAFIQLKPGTAVTEDEIIDFCVGKIATFRVPRYVRFVTEWPMSGTKIKKAILREMIAADLKEKGITRAPRVESAPSVTPLS